MLSRLIQICPVRYTPFFMVLGLTALSLLGFVASGGKPWLAPLIVFTMLAAVGFYDLWQSQHAVLRNYPIIGHLRFMLEAIRPELRQYFLESDTEAVPFSRAQRSLVYARA
ncbi:MAG: FMN-binding glutamate synthase family protein, partial [Quisquiliibacterium sp.]